MDDPSTIFHINLLNIGLIAVSAYFLYKYLHTNKIARQEDGGVNNLFITEDKFDIDNVDRLSRYGANPMYKDSQYLSEVIGSAATPATKLQRIMDIYNDVKSFNYNYMLKELGRDDYQDTSMEQYKPKIFTEYVFQ